MFVPLKTQPETVKFVYFPLAQQLLDLQLFNSSLWISVSKKFRDFFLRKHQVIDPQWLQNLTFPFKAKEHPPRPTGRKKNLHPETFSESWDGIFNTRTNGHDLWNIGSPVVCCVFCAPFGFVAYQTPSLLGLLLESQRFTFALFKQLHQHEEPPLHT